MISLQDEFLICNTGWVMPSFGGWYSFVMRTCWLAVVKIGMVINNCRYLFCLDRSFLRYKNPCRFKSHWLVSFIPLPLRVFPFLFSRNKYDPVTIPASVCFGHSYHTMRPETLNPPSAAGSLGHRFAGDQPCILDAKWKTYILQFRPRYPS